MNGRGQQRAEAEGPRRLLDAGGHGLGGQPPPLVGESQLVLDVEGEELLFRVLKERARLKRQLADGAIRRGRATHTHASLQPAPEVVRAQAVGEAHQRGFPAAAGPGAQHHFTGGHGKGYVPYRGPLPEGIGIRHLFKTDHQRIPPVPQLQPTACWQIAPARATAQAAATSHVSERFQTSFL